MTFSVVVPATLSNLGPGFDVLGMAVSLFNTFDFEPWGAPGQLLDEGRLADEGHAVANAIAAAEQAYGVTMPHGLQLRQTERVPRARGLGSSATAHVAGLLAWSHFTGHAVELTDALLLLSRLEGHPDNIVAAMLGGVTFSTTAPFAWRRIEPLAGLSVVVCIPEVRVSTAAARGVLPATYDRADVVFNSRRLAMLMHGLLTGDAGSLRLGMEDRVHQPYRKALIGPVDAAIDGAISAGAASAFISGSGSTLAAFVLGPDPAPVAAALVAPFHQRGVEARAEVLTPIRHGAWPG